MNEEITNQKTTPEKLLCPKAGTATSFPPDSTTSQSINIVNTMLYMKRNAYADTTTKKVAKLLRHLKKKCNTKQPEEVKLYIANKTRGNGHKQNLIQDTCLPS